MKKFGKKFNSKKFKTCNILGIRFAVADIRSAVKAVLSDPGALSGQYICFANVHTSVLCEDDPNYRAAENGAAYVFADGAPIAFAQRMLGFSKAKRVAGPDFMERVFRATSDGRLSHFFYGSSKETLERLEKSLLTRYPRLRIKGMLSPPYRNLSRREDEDFLRRINEAQADLVWIGLGAPKQEKWMAEHKGRLHGLMIGVGAGFDFHAGTVKRAPKWVQLMGLEWLFRLSQDPKRLLFRYISTNPRFIYLAMRDWLKALRPRRKILRQL